MSKETLGEALDRAYKEAISSYNRLKKEHPFLILFVKKPVRKKYPTKKSLKNLLTNLNQNEKIKKSKRTL